MLLNLSAIAYRKIVWYELPARMVSQLSVKSAYHARMKSQGQNGKRSLSLAKSSQDSLQLSPQECFEEEVAISFPTYGQGYILDYGRRDGSESEAYKSSTIEG